MFLNTLDPLLGLARQAHVLAWTFNKLLKASRNRNLVEMVQVHIMARIA